MSSTSTSKLECDRYGVPQYSGDAECFEEYEERCWDLFYGRDGQDSLQIATPIHLRAGLSGAAYEAVRKVEHSKLRTAVEGKATEAGMKLFLATLRENIAAEKPVKINELFLTAFYSPSVWRRTGESMQQYIIRREQDFNRLKEASSETNISMNLRCMMLLIFSGLDHREQLSILASVNNEYDFKKVSHALRIQYPTAGTRPVMRKDFLGSGRQSSVPFKPQRWKTNPHKSRSVLAVEDQEIDDEEAFDDAYYEHEEDFDGFDGEAEEAYEAYSDDEELEALMAEMPDCLDNPEAAEALATVAQFRHKKKMFKGGKGKSQPSSPSNSYPFVAKGDIAFDPKSKENRQKAVRFLKSVTPCTSCHQKGRWMGDPECPNSKKGKSKGGGKKTTKGQPSRPKKPSQNLFVLHDSIESADEAENLYVRGHREIEPNAVPVNFAAKTIDIKEVTEELYGDLTEKGNGNLASNSPEVAAPSFTATEFKQTVNECLVNFRETKLCEHATSNGGREREFHRGANGHTRHITCKECNETVIVARRKQPVQLWSYLVQIAMCTKWGQKMRSTALYHRVSSLTSQSLLDNDDFEKKKSVKAKAKVLSPSRASEAEWDLVSHHDGKEGYPSSSQSKSRVATIVREPPVQAWLFGVHLAPNVPLPEFPEPAISDLDVLQPLPADSTVLTVGPFPGLTFEKLSTDLEYEHYATQVLQFALDNQPMIPEVFRFAYYLYGKVKLAHGAALKMYHSAKDPSAAASFMKRTFSPSDMQSTRLLVVPIYTDAKNPATLQHGFCDVMMVEEKENDSPENYALDSDDPPGLAILDSGCSRTMHGEAWSEAFENELKKIGISVKSRNKTQTFKGVGGQTESTVVKMFPFGIGGEEHGYIHSAETPGNTPMLISRPFMKELGTILNLGEGTVSFTKLGVYDLPIVRTKRGHPAVNLLYFNSDKLDEFLGEPSDLPLQQWHAEGDEQPDSPQHSEQPSEEYGSSVLGCHSPCSSSDRHLPPGWRRQLQDQHDIIFGIEPGWEPPSYHPSPERDEDDASFGFEVLQEHLYDHCEDAEDFEVLLADGSFTVRKASHRKSKKIEAMELALDGYDLKTAQQLQGDSKIKFCRKPPCGKTWMKQVFAGQMGVTLLAFFFGMSVGVPLDISTVGWDASTSGGRKHLHNDLQAEDPYCVVITHPCGPWGNWSRFNLAKGGQAAETILGLREDNRPVLKTVNKLVRDRVRGRRRVFLEQPLGSKSLEEPEMADVKKLIEDGELLFIVVDGCMVGYKDAESKKPYYKPSYYVTTMIAAESVFAGLRCDHSHEHEPLEGSNIYGSRTKQASVWPHRLNQLVINCVVQQADIEKNAATSVSEVYPAEVRLQPDQGGRRPKRRRGRVAVLTGSAAPPVYIRPSQPDVPDPLQESAEPDEVPEDDQGFRAQQASSLEPVLNENEGERRYHWLQVDPDLRKLIRDLHVNFGHCTNVTLQRILRRQGAKIEAIKAAGLLACDACGDSIRRRRPRPVKLPPRYQFNYHLMLDTFYARDGRGLQFAFLNILCEATSFQVVSCLGELTGPPSSQVVLRHFLTSWSSWAGLPYSIQVDRGKEFMARFADYLKNFNVEQEVMPLEAPWKGGKCERAGGLWKELWDKTVSECNVQGLEDALTATTIVTQTRNSFPRTNGYAPNQCVLGQPEVRLPASLLTSEPQEQLEVMESAENPESAMAKTLQIREAARIAQIRLDTSSRVRRALLRQSTPTRGPFPVGSYVYFFRRQQPSKVSASGKNYNWFGPARVIGVELRNPRRLEDPEDATEGTAPHSYWLRYGPSMVLSTGEQLRFASEDELLAAHYVPSYAVDPRGERGARNYVDLRHHTYGQLPDGTSLYDAVNQDHWTSHPDGRVIRHHNVSRRALFDPRNQGCPVPVEQLSTARKTEVIYYYERGDHVLTDTIDDDWTSETAQRELSADWVGETIFWRRERPPMTSPAPLGPAGPSQPGHQQPLPAIPEEDEDTVTPVPMEQEQRTGEDLAETPVIGDLPPPPHHRQLTVAEPEPQPLEPYPEQPVHQPSSLSEALRTPDRLDGYGPTGRRTSRSFRDEVAGPYLADHDWPDGCEDIHQSIKNYKNFGEDEEEESSDDDQALLLQQQEPVDIFLTGKAVRSEVNLKSLSPEDRAKFDGSMAKEWASWMNFGAAEILTEQQIAELPADAEIVGARWVHTDKNKKPRLLAEAMKKKTGKSDAQIRKEFPFEAKSRMVVQGNQEAASEIRSDSPTASLLAFNFVTVISVIYNWFLAAYDASTAYLQSKGIARLLILRPPYPPPPGVSPHDLLRAKGSIYGTRDAGRSWWKKLYRVLRESGWVMSKLEPALFYLFDETYNLTGALVTHVDDLYVTGAGDKFHAIMKRLETEIFLKKKEGKFRFCGKEIEKDEHGTVHLHQADAIESLEYIVLEKHRRTSPNSKLSEEEKSQFRALIGSLGWIARQSRPDVLVNVSMASQKMGSPAIRDILELNKVVKVLKESVDFRWSFRSPKDYQLKDAIVFCMADSSFANGENHKSQCGYLVGISWPHITSGEQTPILILEAYSGSIKRVCRSTLAAEANGFLQGTEAADFVRSLLLEMLNPEKKIHELEASYIKHKMIAFTDAKSLESTLNKDAGAPSDKRVRILLAQIKEMIGITGYDDENNLQVWWCDTAQMLADVLTKIGCEREPLLEAMSSGLWKLEASEVAKAKKQSIREGRQRRKLQKQQQAEDG